MKKILLYLLFVLTVPSLNAFSQASGRVQLFGHLDKRHGNGYGGCWGWTNPNDNREYAIVGVKTGVSIIDVTNADSISERAYIPGTNTIWHEAKTWSHYAYVVSDVNSGSVDSMKGVHIIDLSPLPDTAILVNKFQYAQGAKNIKAIHEIFIDDSGYMYLFGCSSWGNGGVLIFSLADPVHPQYVGEYQPTYIHDGFVRHDTLFGAAINSGGGIYIADIHDKANPVTITKISYTGSGTHNVWTTDDGRYLYSTDEIGTVVKTLKVWDISNLPSYSQVSQYTPNPAAIVHNVMIRGNISYVAWYSQGFVAADISDPANIQTIGTYDSYNGSDGGYNGAWGIYAFASGKAIISDETTGMYCCTISPAAGVSEHTNSLPTTTALLQSYPNPFNPTTVIRYALSVGSVVSLKVYDVLGKEVATLVNELKPAGNYEVEFDGSRYTSGIYYTRLVAGTVTETKKIVLQK